MSVPSIKRERDIIRSVSVRTKDDTAVLQDLPKGRNQISHAFPIIPTFDALSYFTLSGQATMHDTLESYVHDVTPMHFDLNAVHPDADVVVTRLYAYRPTYAADSSDAADGKTHIHLEPYQFVIAKASDTNFFFNDVVCDNSSKLPLHVGFIGPDDRAFDVDYSIIDGHWVITHAHYEETGHGPLHLGRVHASVDAVFSDFSFPAGAPDSRL